ncbi:nuclear transport factor 2 family protein [Paenibacillus macerans]|uniref:nuclear transport factor 2 family protein n=1 Tax=Paenibacillus macerans TaxID=44252 RepID=UPI00203D75CA|nr:nuclear transport factor 2 family protein [Paenibacillus macerans]MCM3702296.1 nuclear transport factor 2 family protein [Paenibacillus macerans]
MKKNMKKMLMASMTALAIGMIAAGCGATTDSGLAEDTANSSSVEPVVSISDSYDNTEELAAIFPIINPTPIDTEMGKNIQNRLLNGFENWNRGYDAWETWGDILYTEDSLYNVHGVKLTLKEYQDSMNATLQSNDIQMGNFNNMIISGDWAAIRYDITTTNRQTKKSSDGSVMEFVHFKDYGDELGTRVVEGWAGTKGADFDGLTSFQTDDAKAAQQAALDAVVNATIPDTTDLEAKYPVTSPTPIDTDMAKKIQNAILNDFENWNQGFDAWTGWADTYYDSNLKYHTSDETMTLAEYKASVKNTAESTDVKRIRFDNMLISGDWAAIHYRITNQDATTGEKTAGDVMQFLHFAKDGNSVKVIECWTK